MLRSIISPSALPASTHCSSTDACWSFCVDVMPNLLAARPAAPYVVDRPAVCSAEDVPGHVRRVSLRRCGPVYGRHSPRLAVEPSPPSPGAFGGRGPPSHAPARPHLSPLGGCTTHRAPFFLPRVASGVPRAGWHEICVFDGQQCRDIPAGDLTRRRGRFSGHGWTGRGVLPNEGGHGDYGGWRGR